ncbi:MAG: type III-B CRISPR module-associated Cmr3 family protein [Alcanivoracaceae bacterium]
MSVESRFIEPLDVLFLRGNKLFGDPGSYGECLIPPWPSVAAGAIRSRMLVDDGVDLAAFGKNQINHPALGTPEDPGSFVLAGFYPAQQKNGKTEILLPPPADMLVTKNQSGMLEVSCLSPQPIHPMLQSSFPLDRPPVLPQGTQRLKPETGYWLAQQGWAAYLQGRAPSTEQLVHSSALWSFDARVGIGMSAATRSAEEGKLFSVQAVSMKTGVGFVAVISGAQPPIDGLLRLGGDGRAATIEQADIELPLPDYEAIASSKRCRIVLTSPGLFPDGWKLPGTEDGNRVTLPEGITAQLVSAAVPRAETLSGWDLAKWQPKPARRVVPTGSVYWLDELEASPEALGRLVERGLWGEPCEDAARRAEGFNRISLAIWADE